jgi:DNA-directed RNA polymerase specialized sigma24 family protein
VAPEPKFQADYQSSANADLARRCAQEQDRFRHGKKRDPWPCYELFRRALVQRDQDAWEAIYQQFELLVQGWLGHSDDGLVNASFERLWKAIDPTKFEQFPTLGNILAYLKRCSHSVAIEARRKVSQQRAHEVTLEALQRGPAAAYKDEAEAILEGIRTSQVFELASKRLTGEDERHVFRASFEWGMKPGEIHARWPHRFESTRQVYRIKENILRRLRRDLDLRALWDGGES